MITAVVEILKQFNKGINYIVHNIINEKCFNAINNKFNGLFYKFNQLYEITLSLE